MQLGTIDIQGETLNLEALNYRDGGLALLLTIDDEDYATLTINIPGLTLEPGEFAAKTYSENEVLRQPVLNSGLFIDTGKRRPAGFAVVEIWRLIPELEAKLNA